MKNILITGIAGFIGYHIGKLLSEEKYNVIGIDSLNDYYDIHLKKSRLKDLGIYYSKNKEKKIITSVKNNNLLFKKIKLEDKSSLIKLFDEYKFDYVVHLAAQAGVRYSIENPQAYIDSNIQGFMNILECCRNFPVKHFIYASSSSVYGNNEKVPFSTYDKVDFPVSLYAATKKSNELMAYTYSYLYNIPSTGLRFFTVYGPWGRPDMAYYSFTKNIFENKPISIYNNGNMKRDFTYIDDIVNGVYRILNLNPSIYISNSSIAKSVSYKIYNIGNNSPVSLSIFVELLEEIINKKAIKIYKEMQAGDVPVTYANIDEIKNDTGFFPKTNLKEGLEKFINWYRDYYNIDTSNKLI